MRRLLQLLLLLAGLALCTIPANATLTCAQGGAGCTVTTVRTCTATAASCNITVTSTHAGALEIMCGNITASQTLSAATTDGTWTVDGSSLGTNGTRNTECEYNLNATGGTTTITCKQSGTGSFDCEFFEFTSSVGNGYTRDTSGGGSDASCTACAGVALTLATSNSYALVQAAFNIAASWTAINQSYNLASNATTGNASAYKIATTIGTTPNWTSTTTTAAKGAIAIYETPASGTFRTQVGGFLVGP